MTTPKQLHALQELDLVLDLVQDKMTSAEEELRSGINVSHVEQALEQEASRLTDVQSRQRLQQLEVDGPRERAEHLEEQLYGGALSNPRDLQSLEQEASNARALAQKQEEELLGISQQAEECQGRLTALGKELADARAAWETRQVELRQQIEKLTGEWEEVVTKRDSLAATLDPSAVRRYEQLRRAKAGVAVARVERGLCQACRMSLPTQHLQRVRSGRQTVLCSSCGRILFLG